MKILSIFIISLCSFQILMLSLCTFNEAKPLPLILESWSNLLINTDSMGKVFRPAPQPPPPAPNRNPPVGPGVTLNPDPSVTIIASKLSQDLVPNHNTASA
ncbi:hypothetical protein Lal_00032592 [Lupinus albus]|uniref:Uncharacterized protein n=1 Tax=Lupinus albus TaxID=3870 RepID=A0A6A5PLI8_LUPAL|nr:hypothetical protein Lalb_Chr01g0021711 [Lupinus albus]KAF1897832.1 hypothetical protein Lal_00032592 [Lupinus albus]